MPEGPLGERTVLEEGAAILWGFATTEAPALLEAVERVSAAAPFRHMTTPGGYRMSVAMTNCGPLGWVSEPKGYRYDAVDPLSDQRWPAMPEVFQRLALRWP